MPIREPAWWYAEAGIALPARLLAPAAAVYGTAAVWRFRHVVPYRARLPVICIGNLVAGGAGKTPMALAVARLLQVQGQAPAFLSRGYGGTVRGPHQVEPARDRSSEVGDEPLLLARTAPTFVARDRVAGARAIERTTATHIIMDDGLQNPSLAKTVSLAVIDGARGIGNGRVIPAGPLRAPLAFQMRLIDAVVISASNRDTLDPPAAVAGACSGPILRAQRHFEGPLERLAERPWVAFAGVGRPEGFYAMLEQAGARIAARESFKDHHPYTATDAERLIALAAQLGAGLITTEKDHVRLSAPDDGPLRRLADMAVAPGLGLAFAADDDAALRRLLTLPPHAGAETFSRHL